MSGPIVRRYGFPNFEKIFGERPLTHGKDEEAAEGKSDGGESSTTRPAKQPAVGTVEEKTKKDA
ncbi:hypothetical protein [Aquisphaera insulae]|uniref:hypothetical protein n=1 Tax=Aquisphaera insulae TaxID=2712864 RepID=UPI0013EC0477|nr:hypothetical protein [Aquisphaera insulae]